MTNAKQISESVDLNLDTDYLEKATVSLIREYLARKVRAYLVFFVSLFQLNVLYLNRTAIDKSKTNINQINCPLSNIFKV